MVLLGGGLLIDWIMWIIRWRPYRLLLSRFSHAKKDNMPDYKEAWDTGVGFYAPETMLDQEPSDWSDLTLSTLSEIDPDWADNMNLAMDEVPVATSQAKTYFYNQDYEEPAEAYAQAENASGYYEDEQDNDSSTAQWQTLPYDDDETPMDTEPEEADVWPRDTQAKEAIYYEDDDDTPAKNDWIHLPMPDDNVNEHTSATSNQYGRPSQWPGMFPYVENMEEAATPVEENEPTSTNFYADDAFQDDPLFSDNYQAYQRPSRQGRQLRKLRKSDQDASRRRRSNPVAEENEDEVPMLSQDRPGRLVQPISAVPDDATRKDAAQLRTVTGKPVKRQGIMRIAATDDEPIPGLPPLPLENPFLPKAMPHNPDFSDDDGTFN